MLVVHLDDNYQLAAKSLQLGRKLDSFSFPVLLIIITAEEIDDSLISPDSFFKIIAHYESRCYFEDAFFDLPAINPRLWIMQRLRTKTTTATTSSS